MVVKGTFYVVFPDRLPSGTVLCYGLNCMPAEGALCLAMAGFFWAHAGAGCRCRLTACVDTCCTRGAPVVHEQPGPCMELQSDSTPMHLVNPTQCSLCGSSVRG